MKTNQQGFRELIKKNDKPLVVMFSATWCGPCKMFAPVFEKAGVELGSKYNLAKIDVDECPDLSSEYDVVTVPTLFVIRDGKVIGKKSGAYPTVALLDKWIESVL